MPTTDDRVLGAVPHLYPTAEGYFILDSVPRQWALRKALPAEGEGGGEGKGEVGIGSGSAATSASLAQLRAAVEADEYGHGTVSEALAEYVPLHAADRAALALYEEGVVLSEAGGGVAEQQQAARLFKRAAAASPSVAYHFKLEAFMTTVERNLVQLSGPAEGTPSVG